MPSSGILPKYAKHKAYVIKVMKLSRAAFSYPYQPMKELLDVSDASIKVIQLRLHSIEAAFYRIESLLSRGGFAISLLWCQAANEMMFFCVPPGASYEIRDTDCITYVANIEVIFAKYAKLEWEGKTALAFATRG